MLTIQVETEQLLNSLQQLPRAELEQLVAKAFALKAAEYAKTHSERESELLLQINQGLPPAEAKRMKALIAKRQSYTIGEEELQELIGLTDDAERLNAARLKHLVELAHIRGVTLDEVMAQLGIQPANP